MINNIRRKFLQNFLLVSPVAYLAACDNSNNNALRSIKDNYPELKLKMVTSFPKNLPDTDIPAQRLAKK